MAQAINSLLKSAGFVNDTQQSPKPSQIEVKLEKTPEQTSLRELLEALTAQPDRYSELRSFIETNHQIRAVTGKSKGAWVITNPKGSLDIEQTLSYVNQLSKRFASAQREFNDQRR